jgi:hypothetical protein
MGKTGTQAYAEPSHVSISCNKYPFVKVSPLAPLGPQQHQQQTHTDLTLTSNQTS